MIPSAPPVVPGSAGVAPVTAVVVVGEPFPRLGLLAAGSGLSGRVSATDATGQVRIDTSLGAFTVRSSQPLPEGAMVRLVVQALSPQLRLRIAAVDRAPVDNLALRSTPAATVVPGMRSEPPSLGPPSATDSLAVVRQDSQQLRETSPMAVRLATLLPPPSAPLARRVHALFAALRRIGGSLGKVNPDSTSAGATGFERGGTVARELTGLARPAAEANGDNWRAIEVPMVGGELIRPVCLYLRDRRRRRAGGNGRADDKRFVVEAQLSRLGRVQIDGLVRAGSHCVDLIVRSEVSLDETMRQDIRSIFLAAGEIAGLTGEVGFQPQPAAFVDVAATPPRGFATEIVA